MDGELRALADESAYARPHRSEIDFLPTPEGGGPGTTYRWFGALAPSRVAPRPSCFDTDRPVREDSR